VTRDGWATAAAIRAGELSAEAATRDALAAIDAYDGDLNAFTVTFADEALAAARAADERVAAGGHLPPLLGVPVSVKDHIWMRGKPATNGSLALENFVPDVDCVAVARLLDAGAIVVGKTNNPEFCYRGFTDNLVYGLTRNPWDLGRTPGGSSGGAGASVAAGMTPIALGTDGGGSIRIPAAFCGVVGHKPTFGLVPKEPGFRGWKTLSVDGPLATSTRDAALALSVLAGATAADDMTYPVPVGDLLGAVTRDDILPTLRIAWSDDLGWAPVEPDVLAAFHRALDALTDAGARLEPAHPATAYPSALWNTVALCEGWASEGALYAEWADRMSPGIAEIVAAGRDTPATDYVEAMHERAALTRAWAEFFATYDVVLTPMMQLTAFPVGVASPSSIAGTGVDPFFDDWCVLALPANLTGQPATSVPIGLGDDGLPVALQVMGPRWADATTLAVAAAVERVLGWGRPRPTALPLPAPIP
jgi:Asp-tRNA(Asn)/Glu-tRNA(Gln) amidotransferase A subunit family amidase